MAVTQTSSFGAILGAIKGASKLNASNITTGGDGQSIAVSDQPLANFPKAGYNNFVIMSSGIATQISGANIAGNQGTDLGPSGVMGDTATLSITIPVTPGPSKLVSFDFTFLSEEYPEYVGSSFNDFFSVKFNNTELALDTLGRPISVNNNFFDGKLTPIGTFFDGQTPPLKIQAPVPNNATSVTLNFSLGDVGDGIYDSAAFITNLQILSPQVVFLDFSSHLTNAANWAAFSDKTPGYNMAETDKAFLISKLNAIFSKYIVEFTTIKPSSGDYSTLFIGADESHLAKYKADPNPKTPQNENDNILGLAPVDLANKNKNDNGVILTSNFKLNGAQLLTGANGPDGKPLPLSNSVLDKLAHTVAHEAGHLFGLYHISDTDSLMTPKADLSPTVMSSTKIKDQAFAVILGDPPQVLTITENAHKELENSIGLKVATIGQKTSIVDITTKYLTLFSGNIQKQVYGAHLLSFAPGDDSFLDLEIGNLAPNSTKKVELSLLSGSEQLVLAAQSVEGGAYDVFSIVQGSAGGPGAFADAPLPKFGISLPSGDGTIAFELANINSAGTATTLGGVSTQISTMKTYIKPLSVTDLLSKPTSQTLANLVDFDGNDLGGDGSWKILGQADVQRDGDLEYILVNKEIGRWATLGPDVQGMIDLVNNNWSGDTRVVGTYIDPLITLGVVEKGSPHDSQVRFANDLKIENISKILGVDDYDGDGFQEIYFGLTDQTAALHAIMHADGNIQYANYQNEQQMQTFLTSYGYGSNLWGNWI